MFRTDGLIADNATSKGRSERIPSAATIDTLPSSSCFSKRDQWLCLRAKQPNGSESETGYGEEFRGNEEPDVQERGEPRRDEGTQWIFVESEIKNV